MNEPTTPTTPDGGPLPYEHAAPTAYQWTEKAFELLSSGALTVAVRTDHDVQVAEASGTCPRCTDDVAFTQVLDAVTGEDYGTLGETVTAVIDPYRTIVVACRCSGTHADRPEGVKTGCGISFKVDILRDAP